MRTALLLTICRSIPCLPPSDEDPPVGRHGGLPNPMDADPPPECRLPRNADSPSHVTPLNRQTGVKTLPSHNFISGG